MSCFLLRHSDYAPPCCGPSRHRASLFVSVLLLIFATHSLAKHPWIKFGALPYCLSQRRLCFRRSLATLATVLFLFLSEVPSSRPYPSCLPLIIRNTSPSPQIPIVRDIVLNLQRFTMPNRGDSIPVFEGIELKSGKLIKEESFWWSSKKYDAKEHQQIRACFRNFSITVLHNGVFRTSGQILNRCIVHII